jgi:hypothetical protein
MLWLVITISAYFFLAVVSLFDRYFLVGSIPNPKVYAFFVGILGALLALFLIPIGITFPELAPVFLLGVGAGFVRIFAILFLAQSIVGSEVSRAVPAIGGFLPIFSFLLFFLFLPSQEILNEFQVIAFLLLILGSVLISLKEFSLRFFSFQNLKYPIVASFLFATAYFLGKILFLQTDFLNGAFLILLGGGLGALSFLFLSEARKSILHQKITQKMSGLFIVGQIFGVLGVGALYYAIFLAKPFQVPLINALEGLRYVFLLFFVFLVGLKFPKILKEEISRKILFQKILAILFIGGGLALLAL